MNDINNDNTKGTNIITQQEKCVEHNTKDSGTKKLAYSLVDAIFFVLFIILGCLYVKHIIIDGMSGISLIPGFILPFVVLCFGYFYLSKKKISKRAIAFGSLTLVLSVPFALYETLPPFSAFIVHLCAAYTIFLLGRPDIQKTDGNIIFDLFSSLVIKPFSCFFRCIFALGGFAGPKSKKSNFSYIIVGLIAGLPVFLATLFLLSNADYSFGKIWTDVLQTILDFDFYAEYGFPFPSVLVSLYLFGAVFCSKFELHKDVLGKQSIDNAKSSLKLAPPQLIVSAVVPVLALYIVFFAIQFSYIFGAFAGVLPEGFTYAGYARQGFFELCFLSVINVGLIVLIEVFAKADKSGLCPKLIKMISCVISGFTMLLIISAISKLLMYISIYGFTPNRIYPTVFLIFLMFVFVFIIIKRIKHSFDFSKATMICCLSLLVALMYINVPYYCIKGNIAMYNEGRLSSLEGILYRINPQSTILALEKFDMLDKAYVVAGHGNCESIKNGKADMQKTCEYIASHKALNKIYQ